MRIQFADEESFPNASMLWEANQERSLKGAKGQAALRRLEAALLALPEKKLTADALEDEEGAVCALAALAKHEGYRGELKLPEYEDDFGDGKIVKWQDESEVEAAMLELAAELKVPKMVAIAIIYRNDERPHLAPELRYDNMLRWVQRCLRGDVGWLTN